MRNTSPSRTHRPETRATTTSPVLAWVTTDCALCSPNGATVSAFTTISAASAITDSSEPMPMRSRDMPTARMAVSSERAASPPSPSTLPIRATVGNTSYMRRGMV